MPTSATHTPDLGTVRNRLDRLETFLREDPHNAALLLDAFETALRCGEFERAEFHLRHGQAQGVDPWGWRLREGDLLLAMKRPGEAHRVLQLLAEDEAAPGEIRPVLQHNLAYIDLLQMAHANGVARLTELMESETAASESLVLMQALQVLWLRLLHRNQELERAMDWTRRQEGTGQLTAAAAGVASLVALDVNDAESARRWSQMALAQSAPGDQPLEALNTLATLRLGDADAQQARQLAYAALELNPQDGRSWSVLAFADMAAGDLKTACEHFLQALSAMPTHVGTWHGLGWSQLMQHQLDQAQASFEKALELDRNFSESHGNLAVVQATRNQRDAATESIRRALGLDPACLSAQYAQAILDGETQDPVKSQMMIRRLLGGRSSGLGGSLLDKVLSRRSPKT